MRDFVRDGKMGVNRDWDVDMGADTDMDTDVDTDMGLETDVDVDSEIGADCDLDLVQDLDIDADCNLSPAEHEERIEELKEACHSCSNAEHQELDTSQGDFTTIAAGILLALAAYGIIPAVMGFRLGDLPTVVVYGGFLLLTVIFWFLAEKVKEKTKK
ncbi:MAG: hypothetical protein Q4F21_09210 [Lachnospiraceae bacterium]|nr:hypothetical protein [Lachnospiraceae bacterium]